MIIIAISHGFNCDTPFTNTYKVSEQEASPSNLSSLFSFLDRQTNIESSHVDELIIVSDNAVQVHYTSAEINKLFEEIEDNELEEYSEVA